MHHSFDDGTGRGCTAGFSVKKGSTFSMLTADHCGDEGWTWVGGFKVGTGVNMGTMTDGHSNGSDFKRIQGKGYGPSVWIGEVGSGSNQAVKGKFESVLNDLVCYDGAYSGQRCSNKIVNTDGVVCGGGTCYNNLVHTISTSSSGVVQEGDSGSPVLKGASGGANVGGVLSTIEDTSVAKCVNGSKGPCFYEAYYAAVRSFLKGNPGYSVATQ